MNGFNPLMSIAQRSPDSLIQNPPLGQKPISKRLLEGFNSQQFRNVSLSSSTSM